MFTQNLKCRLGEHEVATRAAQLAAQLRERELLDAEKKAATQSFGDRAKELEIEIRGLAEQVRDRAEYRQVQVTERRDEGNLTIDTIRADTGEIVHVRKMLPHEMQVELFDASREPSAATG